MVSHWGFSDRKSPQISRTSLSILADSSNAVVWTGSTPPVIYKSSSLSNNPFVTVPRVLIAIIAIILNNAVVLMVSTRPLISNSSCPFMNPSVTVPRAPISVDINAMFDSFKF